MIRVSSREMSDSSFRIKGDPLIICKVSVKPLQDKVLYILVSFIGPGKFVAFIANVYKVVIIDAVPEDTDSSGVDGVSSKLL